jgi:hypothetical protein
MKIEGHPSPPLDQPVEAQSEYQQLPGLNTDRIKEWAELTVQDQGAADAIDRLKSREAFQDQAAWDANVEHQWYPNGRPEGVPPGPPPELGGNPGPFSPEPIHVNYLTGQELVGDILEGVMDKGGELNELKQFQNLRQEMPYSMDEQAKAVMAVVDKYVARMEAEGRTTLTPEEKAQMAAEMAKAAESLPDLGWISQPIQFEGIKG